MAAFGVVLFGGVARTVAEHQLPEPALHPSLQDRNVVLGVELVPPPGVVGVPKTHPV
jgi:hypothetical protein